MLILNTNITEKTSPGRIFLFYKQSSSTQVMLTFILCFGLSQFIKKTKQKKSTVTMMLQHLDGNI